MVGTSTRTVGGSTESVKSILSLLRPLENPRSDSDCFERPDSRYILEVAYARLLPSRRAVGGRTECLEPRGVSGHRAVSNEDGDPYSFTLDVNVACSYLDRVCDRIDVRLHEYLPSGRGQRIDRRLQRREVPFGGVHADDQ